MQRFRPTRTNPGLQSLRAIPSVGKQFASHETVSHGSKEYARGDVTVNSAEGLKTVSRNGLGPRIKHQKVASSGDSLGALGLPACEPSLLLELELETERRALDWELEVALWGDS